MQNDDLLANVTEVAGSKVLPPCVILGQLGRGGMGAVYRARHLNLAIDVAVKVLKPQLVADDPQFVQRFKREGQSAAAISHQNVIRVFDVAEHAGVHFIIMELVVGENARDRVRRKGPLPLAEAVQILHDAAQGLGAAHALGIVHRDVKPDNLLIAHTGQLKVADLGLAKPTMGTGGASLMSTANQIMGTPSYMPPEQWESPAVGPQADVWALGATMWFLLTGEEAFDSHDGNYPRVMKQIVLQPFPDVRTKRPDVPDELHAILATATAKDPAHRYPDANELAHAIERLALPRVSLRDRIEPGEAQTLVSPSPKNLEQIKQWLREDNLTRVQTPPGSRPPRPPLPDGAMATTPRTPGEGGAPPPSTVSAYELPQRRRRRAGLWAAVGLLAAGGAAAGYFVSRPGQAPGPADNGKPPVVAGETPQPKEKDVQTPVRPAGATPDEPQQAPRDGTTSPPAATDPPPDRAQPPAEPKPQVVEPEAKPAPPPPRPFAAIEDLAAAGKFGEAITAYEALVAARADLRDDTLLASLCGREAERLLAAGSFRTALLLLQRAERLDAAAWREAQGRARTATFAAARAALAVAAPAGAVRRSEPIAFAATLALDAVQRLVVADAPATAADAGRWTATVAAGTAEFAVRAELVDGAIDELRRVAVTFAVERRAVTYTAAPAPTRAKVVDGVVYSDDDDLEISGAVSDADAALLVDDKPLKATPAPNGTFRATVTIPTAMVELPLRIVARKNGHDDATGELRVVWLRNKPVIERLSAATTDRLVAPLRVECGLGITAVEVRLGDRRIPLQRDRNRPTEWIGDVPLQQGDNPFTVAATDVFDRTGTRKETVKSTIQAAQIGSVRLSVGAAERELTRDQVVFVGAGTVSLQATAAGTRPQLALDGNEVKPGLGTVIELREGERRPFTFTVSNELNRVDGWSGELVRDTTPPVVVRTQPAAETPLPTTAPFVVRGTWRDDGGCAAITVDGKAAAVADGNGTTGAWSCELPTPSADRTLLVVARDRAGNETRLDVPIVVARTEAPAGPAAPAVAKPGTAQQFPGFTSDATDVNDLGFPKRIVDTDTGIALVAVPFTAGTKPRFYVGRTLVTERQFSGSGGDGSKLGLSGTEIYDWLQRDAQRGQLDLLTETEFDGLGANPDLVDLSSGPREWLRPARLTMSTWPIRKDAGGRTEQARTASAGSLGFRVVFRVP